MRQLSLFETLLGDKENPMKKENAEEIIIAIVWMWRLLWMIILRSIMNTYYDSIILSCNTTTNDFDIPSFLETSSFAST